MSKYGRIFSKIISQNLEDAHVGYILQNYTYLNFGRIHFGSKKLGDGGNLLGDGDQQPPKVSPLHPNLGYFKRPPIGHTIDIFNNDYMMH